MKLYTEEQLNLAMRLIFEDKATFKQILELLTPIELPSDEGIEEKFTKLNVSVTLYDLGYSDGAKWLKEQIINQNK